MSNLFVFAIGGTGSRVLRDLVNMLATGVSLQGITSVTPIIIDTDATNGDKSITEEIINKYIRVRKDIYSNPEELNNANFFKTEIKHFKTENIEGIEKGVNKAFEDLASNSIFYEWLQEGNTENFTTKYIDFLKLLYDDSDEQGREELKLSISKGYKGNPNIGSVVFNRIKEHNDYVNIFKGQFQTNDKVFVISSIFGGNGSSGFPTIVKLIRGDNEAKLKDAKIGALTILPYYEVEIKIDKAVRSELFDLKAKSALDFYKDDEDIRSINALFLLADKDKRPRIKYNEGEKEQKNEASIIEWLGASAIINFCQLNDNDLSESKTYGLGLPMNTNEKGGDEVLALNNFAREKFFHANIIPSLLKYLYAMQYFRYLKDSGNKKLSSTLFSNETLDKLILKDFEFDSYDMKFFQEWLSQVTSSEYGGKRRLNIINNQDARSYRSYLFGLQCEVEESGILAAFLEKFQNNGKSLENKLISSLYTAGEVMYENVKNYSTL